MIIKILLIAGVGAATLFALRGGMSTANLAVRRLAATAFVLVATLAIAFPESVTWAAERVGVERGSNLVLYALVLAFLFVSVGLHQRIHSLEDRLTRVTRDLALRTQPPPDSSVRASGSLPADQGHP